MPSRLTAFVLLFGLGSLSNGPFSGWPGSLVSPDAAPVPARVRAAADPAVAEVAAFFAGRRTGLMESERAELAAALVRQARQAGLPPAIALAVIHVESRGDNFAVSAVGALGLMQILPETGEALAHRLGVPWRGPNTLFDPAANVRLGIHYLAQLIERFGDLPTALAAYNWGPTRIAERIERGDPIPVRYSELVLAAYAATRAEIQPA